MWIGTKYAIVFIIGTMRLDIEFNEVSLNSKWLYSCWLKSNISNSHFYFTLYLVLQTKELSFFGWEPLKSRVKDFYQYCLVIFSWIDGIPGEIEFPMPRLLSCCVYHICCGANHNILTRVLFLWCLYNYISLIINCYIILNTENDRHTSFLLYSIDFLTILPHLFWVSSKKLSFKNIMSSNYRFDIFLVQFLSFVRRTPNAYFLCYICS